MNEPTVEEDSGHRITTYLCIGCPLGCRLELEETEDHEIVEVRGFSCKKGERFAIEEHTDPQRMVTTTVAVAGGLFPRLPVRTTESVPKPLMGRVCEELRSVTVEAPVSMGDVVRHDIAGTGVNVIASRSMTRAGEGESQLRER